jgi:hypothetical protein
VFSVLLVLVPRLCLGTQVRTRAPAEPARRGAPRLEPGSEYRAGRQRDARDGERGPAHELPYLHDPRFPLLDPRQSLAAGFRRSSLVARRSWCSAPVNTNLIRANAYPDTRSRAADSELFGSRSQAPAWERGLRRLCLRTQVRTRAPAEPARRGAPRLELGSEYLHTAADALPRGSEYSSFASRGLRPWVTQPARPASARTQTPR